MLLMNRFTSTIQLSEIVDTFVHQGLTTFSPSNKDYIEDTDRNRKGVVFLVRNKHDFTSAAGVVKGFIVTSKETLQKQLHNVSQWNPNVYRYGK